MSLLGPLLTLAVCAYATLRGSSAERCASIVILLVLVMDVAGQLIIGWGSVAPLIAADLLLGMGLVLCAALHPRRWLYVEVGLAAGLLLVHAFMLEGEAPMSPPYKILVDAFDLLMISLLGWATFHSQHNSRIT